MGLLPCPALTISESIDDFLFFCKIDHCSKSSLSLSSCSSVAVGFHVGVLTIILVFETMFTTSHSLPSNKTRTGRCVHGTVLLHTT